jgi:ankyrin repeat protein
MIQMSQKLRSLPLTALIILVLITLESCQSSEQSKNNLPSEPTQALTPQTPQANTPTSPADTGLLQAADKCDSELASISLKRGANPNSTFPVKGFDNSLSPLTTVIKNVSIIDEEVSRLRMSEADAQKLKVSCYKLAEFLLSNKADPNLLLPGTPNPPDPQYFGNQAYNLNPSSLHSAVSQYPADSTLVSLLLKNRADPNLKTTIEGRANGFDVPPGTTPLMFLFIRKGGVLAEGFQNNASERIISGSKSKKNDHKITKKIFDILVPISNLNAQDDLGQTLLIIAAKSPPTSMSSEIINTGYIFSKELLRLKADSTLKDKEGKTAADYALEKGNTELVKLLGK